MERLHGRGFREGEWERGRGGESWLCGQPRLYSRGSGSQAGEGVFARSTKEGGRDADCKLQSSNCKLEIGQWLGGWVGNTRDGNEAGEFGVQGLPRKKSKKGAFGR